MAQRPDLLSGVLVHHIPSSIGKAIAQAALPFALLCALSLNRKVMLRPNVFLCLVSLIALGTFLTTLQPQHVGTIFRTVRFAMFVISLWLLTPWWGRRDLLLLRCHLTALSVVLGSVLLGLMVAPGRAYAEQAGRRALADAAHAGRALRGRHDRTGGRPLVLRQLRGRTTVLVTIVAGAILVLTHTRTALAALIAGVLIAGMSLIVAKPRVRKLFATAGAVAAVTVFTFWLSSRPGWSEARAPRA